MSFYTTPGALTEHITGFCAEVDASKANGTHGLPDEGEDIRVLVRSFSEVQDDLTAGRLTNAPILIALQWLAANRERLRQVWVRPSLGTKDP